VRSAGRLPLQIATVAASGVPGAIGLTPCPGKKDQPVAGIAIYLDTDIALMCAWGGEIGVTLVEDRELLLLDVMTLPDAVVRHGMKMGAPADPGRLVKRRAIGTRIGVQSVFSCRFTSRLRTIGSRCSGRPPGWNCAAAGRFSARSRGGLGPQRHPAEMARSARLAGGNRTERTGADEPCDTGSANIPFQLVQKPIGVCADQPAKPEKLDYVEPPLA
jgi:hypothetical protein